MLLSKLWVVVADNDDDARTLLVDAIRELGFLVLEAANGEDLLQCVDDLRARATPIALVVSDIDMPGCDGIEATERMRASEPALPVVLITAFGDQATMQRATRAGACRVLRKPISMGTLKDVVSAVAVGG